MKKKIGILTLNGYNNYGNRLQNYALKCVIEKMGYEVETIIVDRKGKETDKVALLMNFRFSKIIKIIMNKLTSILFSRAIKIRENRFKLFSSKYLNETDWKINENIDYSMLSRKYEYFVFGSDQIWNPNIQYGSNYYFLPKIQKHKKVSYAASFGVDSIENKQEKENYAQWLLNFKAISVRENSGSRIIKDLIDIDVPIHVDPTMLLSSDEWLKSFDSSNLDSENSKYMLTLFLRDLGNKKSNKQKKEILRRTDLKVKRLNSFIDMESFVADPVEFIYLIKNASIILTDSFHVTVFAILFKIPFYVFPRKDGVNSRVITLLNKFNLLSRFITENKIRDKDEWFNIDFTNSTNILNSQKDLAFSYLNDSLQSK